ncbi:hypothetical protein GBF38_005591 [Nibea albiflora]|uniref:Uncharacterized protein n=1 Tax=Nibea albiflora TaxID=240163 RepID=A0ACB7EWU3_NIBAL|nr:hypothetical protein GBF38_005591 [Nibea albiflora]
MGKLLIKQQLVLEDLSLFPRCDPLGLSTYSGSNAYYLACVDRSVNTVYLWLADCLRLEIKALDEESSGLDLVDMNTSAQMTGFELWVDEVKE